MKTFQKLRTEGLMKVTVRHAHHHGLPGGGLFIRCPHDDTYVPVEKDGPDVQCKKCKQLFDSRGFLLDAPHHPHDFREN